VKAEDKSLWGEAEQTQEPTSPRKRRTTNDIRSQELSHSQQVDRVVTDETRVEAWRILYDWVYSTPGAESEFVGWHSSFTGQSIPVAEMEEWREATVRSILDLHPRRVLEVGVGTGMVMAHVAPHCESYIATDFSPVATTLLKRRRSVPRHVELLVMEAMEAVELTSRQVDLVVLNSVVQYFPNADYLLRIIQRVLELLPVGGRVFVGDVRDLRLLSPFRYAVARSAMGAGAGWRALLDAADETIRSERELLVHPDFFARLGESVPNVGCVDIRVKRGKGSSEMNAYRYDVVLERGRRAKAGPPTSTLYSWDADVQDLKTLEEMLRAEEHAHVWIEGVPNRRLQHDVRLERAARNGIAMGTADLSHGVTREHGVDPQDLYAMGDSIGYLTTVTWSLRSPENVDVVYRRPPCDDLVAAYRPVHTAQETPWPLTNRPL